MTRVHLFRLAFYTAVIVAALHILAVVFFLYSFYWWFDIPMHFLAGFCIGLFFLGLFCADDASRPAGSQRALFVALAGSLAVGLVWELFEYLNGITFNAIGNYRLDTVKDVVMDVTGGYAAYLHFVVNDCFGRKAKIL